MTDTLGPTAAIDDDLEPIPATPPPPRRRRKDTPVEAFFHRIFAFFYDKKVGLFLILAMSGLSLIGALVAQASPAVRDDATAYAEFLTTQRGRYGGWTPVMDVLGFFTLFSSPLFLLTTVLLAGSIIGCTLHRMPLLWRKATRPLLHVTDGFFDHAKLRETIDVDRSAQETVVELRRLLGARHYRVLDDPKGEGFSLYADRYRWMPFGTAIAHASFVTLLFGFLVSANLGFTLNLPVTVGSTVPVGHGTNYTVEARSFSDTYHPGGQPMDYVADIVLYENGVAVAEETELRVNNPLRYDGVKFHQSYFGSSVILTVTDAAGEVVISQGIPLEFVSDDEQNSIGRVDIPDTDLVLFVVTPASGQVVSDIPAGRARIEVQRPGDERAVASEMLTPGEPVTAGGYTYTFEREAKYTGLMVRKDPGAIWIWVGCALLVIGTVMTMGFKHRRVWVRVQPTDTGTQVRAATSDKPDTAAKAWFASFAYDVERLGAPAASSTTQHDRETGV